MPPSTNPPPLSSPATGTNRSARRASESELPYKILTMDVGSYSRSKKMANGRYVKSPTLEADGYSWKIVYYPNGRSPGSTGFISLYLKLAAAAAADNNNNNIDDEIKVQYQFMILEPSSRVRFVSAKTVGTVSRKQNMIGIESYLSRDALERTACIKDDRLHIRCDVTVLGRRRVVKAAVTPSSGRLNADLSRLLATMEGADVEFHVHGKVFSVHRCVLAARSPVFKADFFGTGAKEQTGYICVNDISLEAFEALLHYIYTDSLPKMKVEEVAAMAKDLLPAANRYDLNGLKAIIENALCSGINVATALPTLVLAEQHRCDKLKKACLRYIACRKNHIAVMATDGVEDLMKSNPSVVHKVINQILVAREATPHWQLSRWRMLFSAVVYIGILSMDSVGILKLTALGLMMLLQLVLHHHARG